jgi:5-methylcytosine-specific restriction protein A
MGKLTNIKPRLSSAPPRLTSPPKIVEQFYSSPEWRKLVAQIKRQRGACCQRCGSPDRIIADHKGDCAIKGLGSGDAPSRDDG